MLAIASALLFFSAFALSLAVMAYMASAYREKAIAALLFKPQPMAAPVYHVAVRRQRPAPITARIVAQMPVVALAA